MHVFSQRAHLKNIDTTTDNKLDEIRRLLESAVFFFQGMLRFTTSVQGTCVYMNR